MATSWLDKSLEHYEACRWNEAAVALEQSLADEPANAASAWYRLGNVRSEQGRDRDAIECFKNSLALDSSRAKTWNNLGAAYQRLGFAERGYAAYRAALAREPGLFEPYLNLGRLSEARGDLAAAAGYFRAGLAHHPGHPMLVHLLSAATGENPARAPRDHIVAYFDGFAASFDHHLVHGLGYRVPRLLSQAVSATLRAGSRVLDLGCGTGLVGEAIDARGIELVGVDLSPRMLELAEKRGLYSRLFLGDAAETLREFAAGCFDVVLAADVLIYIGDLVELFEAVARALAPAGIFALSVELVAQGSYRLQSNGRYAHALAYLGSQAAAAGMSIISIEAIDIRAEREDLAKGALLVLQRR